MELSEDQKKAHVIAALLIHVHRDHGGRLRLDGLREHAGTSWNLAVDLNADEDYIEITTTPQATEQEGAARYD